MAHSCWSWCIGVVKTLVTNLKLNLASVHTLYQLNLVFNQNYALVLVWPVDVFGVLYYCILCVTAWYNMLNVWINISNCFKLCSHEFNYGFGCTSYSSLMSTHIQFLDVAAILMSQLLLFPE